MSDVSHKTQQAVETAMAGAAEVGRYGRRIVRMIWDPEPVNDRQFNMPMWCLGRQYLNEPLPAAAQQPDLLTTATPPTITSPAGQSPPSTTVPGTPPGSSINSFSPAPADGAPPEDGGWPRAFLDDFESRVWMTYRSGFVPIAKSSDPKASAALSFTMRLKALADQGGFSSDTGWGCMIRSGQSLLANTLSICQLGRGRFFKQSGVLHRDC